MTGIPPIGMAQTLSTFERTLHGVAASMIAIGMAAALVFFGFMLCGVAHADCRMWDDVVVCDDGRSFRSMGEDLVVDDDGHAWVRDGDTIRTDQGYSTPFIMDLFEGENEERSDEIEE